MLWFRRKVVVEAKECFENITRSGELICSVYVILFQMYVAEDGARFVGDGLFLVKVMDEVVQSCIASILHTIIVYDQSELDGLRFVLEQSGSMSSQ